MLEIVFEIVQQKHLDKTVLHKNFVQKNIYSLWDIEVTY